MMNFCFRNYDKGIVRFTLLTGSFPRTRGENYTALIHPGDLISISEDTSIALVPGALALPIVAIVTKWDGETKEGEGLLIEEITRPRRFINELLKAKGVS